MKFTKYLLYSFSLVALLCIQSCEDPLKDVRVVVSSAILEYTTLLQITDGQGNPANNLTVTLLGNDAESIYNLEGYRQFQIRDGLLGLGVHPQHEPTEGNPVTFYVQLSGQDYLTQVIPIIITSEQRSSLHAVSVLRLSDAPPGVSVYRPTVSLVSGRIGETIILSTPLSETVNQTTRITLRAGTQFLDANGNVINGSTLTALIVNLDTDKESSLAFFPGGKLTSNNVYPEGATAPVPGAFNPAAITSIEFFVDGTPVKYFSQPIGIDQQVDEAFHNLATGAPIQVGDLLSVYTHVVADVQWNHDQQATITQADDMLFSSYETDHLTWFFSGNFTEGCFEPVTITFNTSWFETGTTYPLTVEAVMAGKVIDRFTASINATYNAIQLSYLPTSGVTIRVKDDRGAVLGEEALTASCGGSMSMTLADPSTVNDPRVTLQLYVRCPSQAEVVDVLPTFYLYYRDRASGSPEFKFLGVVVNGFISTTLLIPETVRYDFKAIWGDQVKIVGDHVVQEDNSGTVGTAPGDIIGEHAGATNLAILSEKCDELLPTQ
ncbi:hypothetical protein [Parapedobacter koreensis]|uniref:Uncharacterized protein n=1 Tax=Parapedobacter koreensis TaxID=332977 RepID=A0A1H7NRX5_9SPHI|nr:hypothetical protein [Parapedobacter koreensis]SEL25788.1 hypothetical protein SAMN05421740_10470 [Parapedobacter koreensis]